MIIWADGHETHPEARLVRGHELVAATSLGDRSQAILACTEFLDDFLVIAAGAAVFVLVVLAVAAGERASIWTHVADFRCAVIVGFRRCASEAYASYPQS